MRRNIIGILALLLLVGGVLFWIWPPATGYQQFEAACWRIGAILAVVWLAYDDVLRLPGWILAFLPVLIIILAKWPRWIVVAIPVLVVLAILRPRIGRR